MVPYHRPQPNYFTTPTSNQISPTDVRRCSIRAGSLKALEDLRKAYLRRTLGVSSHTLIAPLYTGTGVCPLRYRRAELALRYATYVVENGSVLPRLAMEEMVTMARNAQPSWWGDLQHVLGSLPVPVHMDWQVHPKGKALDQAAADLTTSLARHLQDAAAQPSRLPVLRARHPTYAARPSNPPFRCRHMASLPQFTAGTPSSTCTSPPLGAPTKSRGPAARSLQYPQPVVDMPALQTTGMHRR